MQRRSFILNSSKAVAFSLLPLSSWYACKKKNTELSACGVPLAEAGFKEQSVVEVASHQELLSFNLASWPDSLIGFCKHPTTQEYYGFGFGDAGDIMRAKFSADGKKITAGIRVPMLDAQGNWLGSGGPVYYDAASGLLLMVTHHEKSDPSNPNFFAHVSLRMAKSTNFGLSWTDLGTIIDHHASDETDPYHALTMGNGGFIIKNEHGVNYMMVYHTDMQANGTKNQLAVSRAPLQAVIAAAQANTTPVFNKWNGQNWNQPGLKGQSVDLMPNFTTWGVVGDIDPFYVPALQKYVAFYPSCILGNVNPPTWNVLVSMSTDGYVWEPVKKLYREDIAGHDPIYTGVMAHNRVIEGCSAKLYRMFTTDTSSRWDFNKLDLVSIAIEKT